MRSFRITLALDGMFPSVLRYWHEKPKYNGIQVSQLIYTCTESKTVQSKQLIAKPWTIVQHENVDAKQQFAGNHCIYLKQKLYNIGNILPRATPIYLHIYIYLSTAPISHVVERPLWERQVVGSNPGHAIPKALKMVLAAPLLALH